MNSSWTDAINLQAAELPIAFAAAKTDCARMMATIPANGSERVFAKLARNKRVMPDDMQRIIEIDTQ